MALRKSTAMSSCLLRSTRATSTTFCTKQLDLYLFVNLIKALANNAPLVLLDADLNETEIDGVNVAEINVPTKIVSTTFVNMEACWRGG